MSKSMWDIYLTQEQLAIKLNVSRQAVSNWENNKNLPGIGMLILMSNVFGISLDQLIKGNCDMNNMTKKVIQDGSEIRKAKFNMITAVIGGVFLGLGIIFLVIKAMSVEYIDINGILHENFFLLPIGYICIFSGFISFASIGIRMIIDNVKKK